MCGIRAEIFGFLHPTSDDSKIKSATLNQDVWNPRPSTNWIPKFFKKINEEESRGILVVPKSSQLFPVARILSKKFTWHRRILKFPWHHSLTHRYAYSIKEMVEVLTLNGFFVAYKRKRKIKVCLSVIENESELLI